MTILCQDNYSLKYSSKERSDKVEQWVPNVFVYDKDNNYIDSFPSITKAAKAYNISLTTLWRGLQDGRMMNNYYFREEL